MSGRPEVRIGGTYRVKKNIPLRDVTIPEGSELVLLRTEGG